ncbi:hypothetical protein NX059_011343 [Plenodomus lindquistii]|nr:hypothetical protein NX059_011343 [Plenodomus lindquistii]
MASPEPPSLSLTPSIMDTLPPLSALLPPLTPLFPKTPQTPTPLPVDFLEILENWQIPNLNISAILPTSLCPASNTLSSTNINSSTTTSTLQTLTAPFPWTDPLRDAIITLSKLTVGQRDRAHSLLCTYFSARIREASYKGNSNGIYATLEVCDVDKAIESVRRMSRGREMEGSSTSGKRKYSIRDEEAAERARQRGRHLSRVIEVGEEDEEEEDREGRSTKRIDPESTI